MPEQPRSKVRAILLTIASLLLALVVACGAAATGTPSPTATTAPTTAPAASPTPATAAPTTGPASQPGPDSTPASGDTPTPIPYAFAARAFVQELEEKFPFPPPVPGQQPHRGGVLHIATSIKPDMDPVRIRDSEWYVVWDQMLEWEAQWYYPEVQTTPTIRKNLVESWEMVDPSTWDFKIKEGVHYQDISPLDGRELTAQDIKYSYDLLRGKPGWGGQEVESVDVLDQYRVRFHLNIPLTDFPRIHTNGTAPVIVPQEGVEAPGGLHENPVGTGSFILEEFVSGEGVLFVKNPNYHLMGVDGQPLPYVDALRYIFTRGEAVQLALYRAGQVDIMRLARIDTLDQLLRTNPDSWVYRVPSFGWGGYGIWLNFHQSPFDNKQVRQALSMALDRDVMREVINSSDAALYGPFPWALAGFTEFSEYSYENLGPNWQYNPQRARELLAEAGIPEGYEIDVEFGEIQGYVYDDFAVLVQKFWQDVGLKVNLVQLESGTWLNKQRGAADLPPVMIGLTNTGSGPTAYDWVYTHYHSASPPTINRPHVEDPFVDGLLDEWKAATAERQMAIQKELWDYLTDQVYRIHTIVPPHYRPSQPYVHAGGNPYCWHPGFCSYEAKTTWLTGDAPQREFDRFAE